MYTTIFVYSRIFYLKIKILGMDKRYVTDKRFKNEKMQTDVPYDHDTMLKKSA